MIDPSRVASVLGGRQVLRRKIDTIQELMDAVQSGLPRAALDSVVGRLAGEGPAATELRCRIIPRTTLARRSQRLSPEESERLERLARLVVLAEHVWEDGALAREFLMSPQPQLEGMRPVDLVRTDLGGRRVESLLLGLEYSLPV